MLYPLDPLLPLHATKVKILVKFHSLELHWLGSKYFKSGPEGNDIHQSNVPDSRISFRYDTWKEEMQYVYSGMARLPEEIDF
ncbi:hypothetical protein RHGRI_034524 [Rhododendron griersonianum]|uniref:Uncharacterized protein n=1 Tax=Rhododendron griersonianum TaxID=479676 RepID=A0AAV6I3P5_9ERIC|nr:hypothetical protein RHGRI_034524 [Rhododendron griersonianum]